LSDNHFATGGIGIFARIKKIDPTMINGMAKSIPFFKAVIARVFTNFIIGGKTLLFMKPFINKPPLRCEPDCSEMRKIVFCANVLPHQQVL
jgi:hypothetical protein